MAKTNKTRDKQKKDEPGYSLAGSKRQRRTDEEEVGSTEDFEKPETLISQEVYENEEKFQAEKASDIATEENLIEQLKREAEIENNEVLAIPEDKAEFATTLDQEVETTRSRTTDKNKKPKKPRKK